jgi:hypothetical protein
MGKTTKRKVPFAARKTVGTAGKPASNPFEAVKGKQRFNVIGRKASSTKNVNQARSDAFDMVRFILTYEMLRLPGYERVLDLGNAPV